MEFGKFRRTETAEMYPWKKGYSIEGISISEEDKKTGSPKEGDMIARNPDNHKDQWLVGKTYFETNFAELDSGTKTLHNSEASGTKKNVPDVIVYGEEDLFKLLSKASSKEEDWMKSTKGMDVGTGVMVQVSTQQGDNVAEALCFIPGARLEGNAKDGWKIV